MKHDEDNWLQFHKYDENYKRRTIEIHVDDDDDGDGGGKCVRLRRCVLEERCIWRAFALRCVHSMLLVDL